MLLLRVDMETCRDILYALNTIWRTRLYLHTQSLYILLEITKIGSFPKTSIIELCYHKKIDNQQENQEKRKFIQVKGLSAHDAMVDVVIMDIIEKHANNQSHYILEMNIVVLILLKAISTSKNSPYNQFISHFNNVTIEFVFWDDLIMYLHFYFFIFFV